MSSITGGCISRAFYNDLRKARASQNKKAEVLVQWKNKNGKWGVPYMTELCSAETPDQAVERLMKLNPGRVCRLA